MKSIRELLLLGPGPSSSHTIGPYNIAKHFLKKYPHDFVKIDVTLYGSLALTGKGHATDRILKEAFKGIPTDVFFNPELKDIPHPNTLQINANTKDGQILTERYLSLGGGAFILDGESHFTHDIYPFTTFDQMKKYMSKNKIDDLYDLLESIEGGGILEYGKEMLRHSFDTVEEGLKKEGYLPGPLHLESVAKKLYEQAIQQKEEAERRTLLLSSYAYATAESNARGEMIVTAPTCGAAGVVPAVLYYEYKSGAFSFDELTKSYLVGALVCDFIKENASISGALLGCQAEIGSAASFASSSLAYLYHLSTHQIEYAAEVSMEHFLGLTCDPVDGYVQIPCIERNAIASIHAYAAFLFAKNISIYRQNRVSFDKVVQAMKETGDELPADLKETSLGGLAKVIG